MSIFFISAARICQRLWVMWAAALVCNLLYMLGLGDHLNFMIIGSMMPLVPGVAFTVAIRDAADGDYISGTVRMIDALLVFICIAIGVGMGIAVLNSLTGGAAL